MASNVAKNKVRNVAAKKGDVKQVNKGAKKKVIIVKKKEDLEEKKKIKPKKKEKYYNRRSFCGYRVSSRDEKIRKRREKKKVKKIRKLREKKKGKKIKKERKLKSREKTEYEDEEEETEKEEEIKQEEINQEEIKPEERKKVVSKIDTSEPDVNYEEKSTDLKPPQKRYNFTKYCSPRCKIPIIQNWKFFLCDEKLIIERRKRTVPLRVTRLEFKFLKISPRELSKVIFGKRLVKKHEQVHMKYYMIKAYKKEEILKWNYFKQVKNEKKILSMVKFHFISHLEFFFQDKTYIYFGFPFIPGLSLRYYINKEVRIGEELIKFYAAQIFLAIEYLHSLDIMYRNLKPDNIIVAPNGSIKLIGFMKAKTVQTRTFTKCFNLEYAAPETITNSGYGKSVDWWAFAVTIFEMSTGFTPFYTGNCQETLTRIVEGKFKVPGHLSYELRDLIEKMLKVPLGVRIGTKSAGFSEIKYHKWFNKISWNKLINDKVPPPFEPDLENPMDENHFFEFSNHFLERNRKDIYRKLFKDF